MTKDKGSKPYEVIEKGGKAPKNPPPPPKAVDAPPPPPKAKADGK